MATHSKANQNVECEEEYVLIDLDDVCGQVDISSNSSYTLSGLDTTTPTLTIGDKVMIGEYQETIGTCFILSETTEEEAPSINKESRSADAELFAGKCAADPNKKPFKQINTICKLHKVLKFRLQSNGNSKLSNDA
ncbi:uncharacterized protein LOC116254226 [Nymphaea colorata]|nr:uncharacterized protein LOC116254226 [Nymphaea colorata]XP_031485311.1 uncharacterized protein LOC116254226 [Nymphaea colorata]XP_031485312.1 uncharacterized protein LOC116254226 [Nymphaea colorata]XP_049933852.1 uncharacterized protein LOC116254226 [Nymphaea colorata]